jgi:DNA-binding Lrp family transcriptional regulator
MVSSQTLRIKIKRWKEEQKILSLLNKHIPQTLKIISLRCDYTPQKCTAILMRLVECGKVRKVELFNTKWYTLNT